MSVNAAHDIVRGEVRGESSNLTYLQYFILTCALAWSLLSLDHVWRIVWIRESLSLLTCIFRETNWYYLVFFHAYSPSNLFFQFGFIASSWKDSFQPSFSCLWSVHSGWKTFSLSCSKICFVKKREDVRVESTSSVTNCSSCKNQSNSWWALTQLHTRWQQWTQTLL